MDALCGAGAPRRQPEAGDPYFNPNFDHGREDFFPDMRARKLKARCVVNRRLLPDGQTTEQTLPGRGDE